MGKKGLLQIVHSGGDAGLHLYHALRMVLQDLGPAIVAAFAVLRVCKICFNADGEIIIVLRLVACSGTAW